MTTRRTGPRHAVKATLNEFGRIDRVIFGNMERQGKIRKEAAGRKIKYTPAPLPLVDDDVEFINRELMHCNPIVTSSPYTSHEPTRIETEDFERRIQDIEDRLKKQREKLGHFVVGNKKKVATAREDLGRIERRKEGGHTRNRR